MAERRMFSKQIIDSDAFLDMSLSTQALYFHLSMRADDDGFINNPKKILRMIGGSDDELKMLLAKKFIITFESGVIVIKHWKMHNYIRNDRYIPTVYSEELSRLTLKDNKSYSLNISGIPYVNQTDTKSISLVDNLDTQVRLGKDRSDKDSIDSTDKSHTPKFIIPKIEDIKEYCTERQNTVDSEKFFDFYESKGWMIGKNKMKDWKAAIRNWEKDNKPTARVLNW
jgi:hypothetical protein